MSIILPDTASDPELTAVPPLADTPPPTIAERLESIERQVTEIHTAMVFLARQAQSLQGSPLAKLLKLGK